MDHLLYARYRSRLLCNCLHLMSSNQNIDGCVPGLGSSHRMVNGRVKCAAIMFSQYQDFHICIPSCARSLANKSCTLFTLTPGFLAGGSATLINFKRGWVSASNSLALSVSMVFFLAIIKLGNLTKRGSFRRKSVVTTAGR